MRARSALFTLFGDVVRPAGGEAWLSTLTGCMGTLGFTPEATRTALHRMTAEGWVEPRKVGRYAAYRLTPRGVDRLEEAAGRIYRLRAVAWDRRWRLLTLPRNGGREVVDELHRALRWMGFGRLQPELWVSPHDHGDRLTETLEAHGVTGSVGFVTDPAEADEPRDRHLVASAWDLDELRSAHADFVARWRGVRPPRNPRAAFTTRIRLVHDWRSFLFLDPGLPPSLLPSDWLGDVAAERFRSLYEAVEGPAWAFHDALVEQAPAQQEPLAERDPQASPFAHGLEALASRGLVEGASR